MLVTGGAGFIGANFIPYFTSEHPDIRIINIDKLTYAGDLANISEVAGHSNYEFVQGDICDRDLIVSVFKKYDITGVIHFAAESHVD
ncbi:GDP-mannose 4,6-dehydratase, partial [Psychroserpens mesophilus]|uniref:GDP-mannose 4,6-dehydratase n=1 Tax=Psychroserpens mesophilus TaxID=325473 RepID=UPI003D661AE9